MIFLWTNSKVVRTFGLLTHWGWVTHICISNLTIIGSDNGLLPGRRQAIICTNAGILLIWTLGTNFSETLSEINTFSFKKMYLKMSSGKWWPFCLSLNVLISKPSCWDCLCRLEISLWRGGFKIIVQQISCCELIRSSVLVIVTSWLL